MTQLNNVTDLPTPDPDALAQSKKLVQRIKQNIKAHENALAFDAYMSQALYEPGLGYYSAGARKFGEAGDFVTAPEISSLFSRCLANQCRQVIEQLSCPVIMELGAGSGIMACDILTELDRHNALPDAYWILEVSADLKQRQQQLLKERAPFFYDKVCWLEQLPNAQFNGVILANEVVDALPIKRFVKKDTGFYELGVAIHDDQFCWIEMSTSKGMLASLNKLETVLDNSFPDGYISEINLHMPDWLDSLARPLAQGVMFVLDYGYSRKEYYHPDRNQGTLLCYYRHRVHDDPFFYPGLQDITASVDFTALAENAVAVGMDVKGYTTQAYFLLGSGLEALAAGEQGQDIKQQTVIAQQLRTLTLPGEMGEKVKVMALGRGLDGDLGDELMGFSINDLCHRL